MKRYVCPYCYGRGGYYKPIYCDGVQIGKKWDECPKCKDGIIKD